MENLSFDLFRLRSCARHANDLLPSQVGLPENLQPNQPLLRPVRRPRLHISRLRFLLPLRTFWKQKNHKIVFLLHHHRHFGLSHHASHLTDTPITSPIEQLLQNCTSFSWTTNFRILPISRLANTIDSS